MITINSYSTISGIGMRSNNEDSYGVLPGSVYIVCDGVGGNAKGEIASRIVCNSFIQAFKKSSKATPHQALDLAEKNLSTHKRKYTAANSMATTIAAAIINCASIQIVWCGDSRVYHFRNGKILFKTVDHSWVNEAIAAGIITPEQAVSHPRSRVITRAVQGLEKPEKMEEHIITDLQLNDLFLVCSDGILESWDDTMLEDLFSKNADPDQITGILQKKCEQNSKDNFTAVVFSVGTDLPKTVKKKSRIYQLLFGLFIVSFVIFIIINNKSGQKLTQKQSQHNENFNPDRK